MNHRITLPLIAALGVAGYVLATSVAGAGPPAGFTPGSTVGPGDHVPICHALGNGGYEAIAPSAGVVYGHAGSSHQDGRDIIPPFVYAPNKGDVDSSLAGGQHWAEGQAVWANDCVAGAATTTTTPSTTTPSTTTSPSTSTTTTTTPAATTAPATTTAVSPSTTTEARTSTEEATTTTTETLTPPLVPATRTTTTPAAKGKGAVEAAHADVKAHAVKPSHLAFTP